MALFFVQRDFLLWLCYLNFYKMHWFLIIQKPMTPDADFCWPLPPIKSISVGLLKVFVRLCEFWIGGLQDLLPQSLVCFLSILVANYKGEKLHHRITPLLQSFVFKIETCHVEVRRPSPFQCSKIYLGLVYRLKSVQKLHSPIWWKLKLI